MSYKKTIDDLLSRRFDHLLECAENVLKRQPKMRMTHTDLVSELAIYLYEPKNKAKVKEYIAMNKLEAFCVGWISTQGRFSNSTTHKKHNGKHFFIDEDEIVKLPEPSEFLDTLGATDYERDLSLEFTDEQIEKILAVENILDKLTKSELILFEAYFVEDLSYDKIAKKYTFYREKDGKRVNYKSKKSVYEMMKSLKGKILNLVEC